ncbi:YveK family protein [Limosilactobacillus fermentum]|uniref:YveK family protein n=1 Tax=Limosilactobacillus fermentum TaxID=1613 RepID=UPI001F18D3F6|nr:Wzz/FepE/Etk N-terminal domain-containing protein [Limosilactobacillus fermentum]UJP15429.1 Wzz/FepE/Etk N-terminal domain-containing protein [Limosilactobacillus fermentum]
MESEKNTNAIDLQHLWKLFVQHMRMILIWTVGLGVIAWGIATFVIPAKYTATTQILVNQRNSNDNNGQAYNNQQADIQMINTYKDIITNQVILKSASKQLANPSGSQRAYALSVAKLKDSLKVSTQTNSQVFSLSAEAGNPTEAKVIANTVAKIFKKQIRSMMNVNNVTIVSEATAPTSQSFPNKKLFALAGLVLGFLISYVYVLLRDLTDTTVRDNDFMTNELGLTNLGQVGEIYMPDDFEFKRFDNQTAGHRRV